MLRRPVLLALALVMACLQCVEARAQCRSGDYLIGEDEHRYYCSSKSCADLEAQSVQDRRALDRLQKSISDVNAELKEWTKANKKAAQDAVKVALDALYDAALAQMQTLAEGKLERVQEEFARRAPYGERWQAMLEKVVTLRSQSARLHATIDGLKLGQYPLSNIESAWIEIRDWAAETGKQSEGIATTLRELRKDPDGADILREAGVDFASDGLKAIVDPLLGGSLTLGDFFVKYGYDATAWKISYRRITEEVDNQEVNRIAMCKLSLQYKKTVTELGICHGQYPVANAIVPDPASCL